LFFLENADFVAVFALDTSASPEPAKETSFTASFIAGLKEAGHVEGRNVAIEFGWMRNDATRLQELAGLGRQVTGSPTGRHGIATDWQEIARR